MCRLARQLDQAVASLLRLELNVAELKLSGSLMRTQQGQRETRKTRQTGNIKYDLEKISNLKN